MYTGLDHRDLVDTKYAVLDLKYDQWDIKKKWLEVENEQKEGVQRWVRISQLPHGSRRCFHLAQGR